MTEAEMSISEATTTVVITITTEAIEAIEEIEEIEDVAEAAEVAEDVAVEGSIRNPNRSGRFSVYI